LKFVQIYDFPNFSSKAAEEKYLKLKNTPPATSTSESQNLPSPNVSTPSAMPTQLSNHPQNRPMPLNAPQQFQYPPMANQQLQSPTMQAPFAYSYPPNQIIQGQPPQMTRVQQTPAGPQFTHAGYMPPQQGQWNRRR
jgi:hypothetical protein